MPQLSTFLKSLIFYVSTQYCIEYASIGNLFQIAHVYVSTPYCLTNISVHIQYIHKTVEPDTSLLSSETLVEHLLCKDICKPTLFTIAMKNILGRLIDCL